MTETLPERVAGTPVRQGVDLLAVAQQADRIKDLGRTLIASGLLPESVRKPEAALLIMLKAQEIGIGPVYGLNHITVVKGKPTLSAELMRALVMRAGHKIRTVELTDESCTLEGERGDDPGHPQRYTFSMDDARQAGLAGNHSWKKYPKAMLSARATSALCRLMFPDAIAGASYTAEELGVEMGEDGEIVEATEQSHSDIQQPPTRYQEDADQEPDIEEAEVVDDPPAEAVDPSAKVSNDQLRALRDAARELYGQDGIRELQKKIGKQLHLLSAGGASQVLDRLNAAIEAQSEDGENSGSDEIDLDEGDIEDMERMASGDAGEPADQRAQGRQKSSERPARKSQVDLLKTLAVELRGEDGVARLEDRIGRPLAELTRAEADDWISALTPEERE